MNDFFLTPPADPPSVSPPDDAEPVVIQTRITLDGIEVTTDRRRRDSDMLVEPGIDARTIARLIGQDIQAFVTDAITNHLDSFRVKLRA